MKFLTLLVFIGFANYGWSASCEVDGKPVMFKPVTQEGTVISPDRSLFIRRSIAKLGKEAVLHKTYNPFYGIGGDITLEQNKEAIKLLIWDSDHDEEILYNEIIVNNKLVVCRH